MVKAPTWLQGIAGSIPFQAIAWLTTYYQLLGFSDGIAALLMFLFLFSTAFGGLLGGYIGDRCALSCWHHHSRPASGAVNSCCLLGVVIGANATP